jgi:type I restriction enzyme S subunit
VDFGPTRAKAGGAKPYLPPEIWSLFPDRLDDNGLPEGWEVSEIGKETKVVGGSTPSTKEPRFWGGGIHWTTPKDLSALKSPVLFETNRTITEAGLEKISSGLLPVGTVLLSSRAPIGYVAIAAVPVAVNQGYIALRCEGRLSNVYVWLWLHENMEAIKGNANGSTFQEISKKNFRPLPVVVPSMDVMDAFNEMVMPLYERIEKNELESRTLAQTRDLLLPKLMSGKIRLQDVEGE